MKTRYFKIIVTLVFFVSICMSVSGFVGMDVKYRELASMTGLSSKDKLQIPFSKELDGKTIINRNVYVLDQNRKKVQVILSLSNNKKIIIVSPANEYEYGSYTLFIEKAVRYTDGRYQKQGMKMFFTVNKGNTGLPLVKSIENLKEILENCRQYTGYGTVDYPTNGAPGITPKPPVMSGASKAAAVPSDNVSADDYSRTNIQVQGVDEGDIIKTDGEYIYEINKGRLIVVKAVPAANMGVESIIQFDDKHFSPIEIYIDNKYLIVLGNSLIDNSITRKSSQPELSVPKMLYGMRAETKAILYNIKDKKNIKKIREVELDGNYVSSRKIGSKFYMISNLNAYYYFSGNDLNAVLPAYKDTAINENYIDIDYNKIYYFPGSAAPNFMLIGSLDTDNNSPMNVSTYLGAGENIYMSLKNLYISVSKYEYKTVTPKPDNSIPKGSAVNAKTSVVPSFWDSNRNTIVYKFNLVDGDVNYFSRGEVPGTILNQFSMDENGDTFRIATTKGDIWRNDENTSKNNLYILDKDMKIIGKLEDMAPGEKIYSVRFMGNRAYVVTFRKVDPLFVIDLKDAEKPVILGKLKIPGYSDYLHPYDENHIIGFGKDSIEIAYKDAKGNVLGTNAFYLGMKIALFDVSDVSNPKEKCHEVIGDRGTNSQLLYNHKALLFSKEKDIMAFPVDVYKLREGQKVVREGDSYPEYGSFYFQGAYIYSIDINKGFTLRGKITHLTDEDYKKAGDLMYDRDKGISRIIYIKDNLYTISNYKIQATSVKDMGDTGEVIIK